MVPSVTQLFCGLLFGLLASLLLIPTVDYDKDMARTIRLPTTQALVTEFERALEVVTTGSDAEWQEAVLRFRAKAEAPGRALGTLRMVIPDVSH